MALLRLSEAQLQFLLTTLAITAPSDDDVPLRDEVHATLSHNLNEIRLASRSPSLAPETPPPSNKTIRVTRSQTRFQSSPPGSASSGSPTPTLVHHLSSRQTSVFSEASTLVDRSPSRSSSRLSSKRRLDPITEEPSPNAVSSKSTHPRHPSVDQPTVASAGKVRDGGQNGDPARPPDRSCMRNSTKERTNPQASRRDLENRINARDLGLAPEPDDDYRPDDEEDDVDDDEILPRPAPARKRIKGQKFGWRRVNRYRALTQEASSLLVELVWGIQHNVAAVNALQSSLSAIVTHYEVPFQSPSKDLRQAYQKCVEAERNVAVATLLNFLTFVEFSLRLDLEKKQLQNADPKHKTVSTASIAQRLHVDEQTFQRYNNKGLKLLIHAHAGTFYLLVLIAAFGLGSHFTVNDSSTAEDTQSISWTLTRLPEGTPEHHLFVTVLIPCLKRLINDRPAGRVFFLNVPRADGTHQAIHFSDYAKTDEVLATVGHEGFKLPPRSPFWDQCAPLSVSTVPTPQSLTPTLPALPKSDPKKVIWPREIKKGVSPTRGMKKQKRHEWTEDFRLVAAQAKTVKDLSEFEDYVRDHHFDANGSRKRDSFINVSADMLQGSDLLIEDQQGNYGMLYCTELPSATPEQLKLITSTIELLFPGGIKHSSSQQEGYTYGTYNFHTLNRFGKSGQDAPRDSHPIDITSASKRGDNPSQRLPGPTVDIKNNAWAHSLLANVLEPLFQDIAAKAFAHLPHEVKQFQGYVDIQPMDKPSPTSPFTGFHLNLRVATDGHEDDNDFGPCAVSTLAKFSGGQLVLHQLGLVIDLKPGQVLFFPSRTITHYNLHFEGERVSLVLSFDKEAIKWVHTANGWKHILATNRPDDAQPPSAGRGPPTKKRKVSS